MMTASDTPPVLPLQCFADTNIIFRSINPNDPQFGIVRNALETLWQNETRLYITAQSLVEFQALATRPTQANGLGLSAVEASEQAQELERIFEFLPETPEIYPTWRALIDAYGTVGRAVYDARIVAVMRVYEIPAILTLNPTDFRRYQEIQVIEPRMLQPI